MSIFSEILPSSIKNKISRAIQTKIVEPTLRFRFGRMYDNQATIIKFVPYKKDQDYLVSSLRKAGEKQPMPANFYAGYGNNEAEYFKSGDEDVNIMDGHLISKGYTNRKNQRVLDLGCGSARMLRNLNKKFLDSELWGLDINANLIYWCKENIGDSANFATSTLIPHLFFESRYFDLIYCGSVFTHIDDLAEAWLLEVRRVLKPGGFFYVTIHDENTVKMLDNEYKNHAFAKYLEKNQTYTQNKYKFDMMVIDRDQFSQVFFSKAYFRQWAEPFFEVTEIIDNVYGYQSVAILRKK